MDFLQIFLFCVLFSPIAPFGHIDRDLTIYHKYETSESLLPHLSDVTLERAKRQATPDPKTSSAEAATTKATANATSAETSNATSTEATVTLDPVLKDSSMHNLGVNGTGQRKVYPTTPLPTKVSDPININTPQDSNASSNQSLGKFLGQEISGEDEISVDDIDKFSVNMNKTLLEHNITQFKEEFHSYYNSTVIEDPDMANRMKASFGNLTVSQLLSRSHRRAMTIQLKFDFPFYGNPLRNITIATGGFLYTGEYVHSWLAATQYIAPLMANFDSRISNNSFVKYLDNGTAFTVLWENLYLQDHETEKPFTFSATLHKTGDVVFAYYSVPVPIEGIRDEKHPVKVGLSDAYISDKTIFFARRKTIYEYHRVTFESNDIRNGTVIFLSAQPTCLSLTDCVSCLKKLTSFKCNWCPTVNRCSTGTDRQRHDWVQKGCEKVQIVDENKCPMIGDKGNNAGSASDSSESGDKSWDNHSGASDGDSGHRSGAGASDESRDVNSVSKVSKELITSDMADSGAGHSAGVGTVLGFLIPIILVLSGVLWVFYAYRNPHTKSGQFLIQYRPSQWSWRRGEARYTAATIHM
ncbi:plexin domain-containing protein 2 isoform X2 [Phlebotomus argentipes]|uniref:plexin domain-containing protein 2 isoform X2 n=1 Tax=Phlebotomus argentipes TaxID=94469 RepID=UPI0028936C8F|nr:plexin domain-containing protein 2 isoform X2 [Phlebotomus argentipes]